MTRKGFQVVSQLYHLLAEFDSKAILAASRKAGISDNLRDALVALHKESENQSGAKRKSTSKSQQSEIWKKDEKAINDVLSFLLNKSKFPTKQKLVELADKLGVKFSADARDSRERTAKKLLKAVSQNEKLIKKLQLLSDAPSTNQTEGWLDLITGS